MIFTNPTPQQLNEDHRGLGFNIVDNEDTLLQLFLSEAIWKKGTPEGESTKVFRKTTLSKKNINELSFFLDDELIMVYRRESEPIKYTVLCPK